MPRPSPSWHGSSKMTIERKEKLEVSGGDLLDLGAEGVRGPERLVDLREVIATSMNFTCLFCLRADALTQLIERKVGAEMEHFAGQIC